MGQLYYGWAITLDRDGKPEEAERKLTNGLRVEKENRSRLAIQSFLETIRKKRKLSETDELKTNSDMARNYIDRKTDVHH